MKQIDRVKDIAKREKELIRRIVQERDPKNLKILERELKILNNELAEALNDVKIAKPLSSPTVISQEPEKKNVKIKEKSKIQTEEELELELETLQRFKRRGDKTVKVKEDKPSKYVKISNNLFSKYSTSLSDKKIFQYLKRDLVKANIRMLPTSYVSVTIFTTILSMIFAFLLFIFLMFFNIKLEWPIITAVVDSLGGRFLKTFWIIFGVPAFTFLTMYFYPSVERKYQEGKVNQELPFVTIHLSAIAGSMVEPSKILKIIVGTEEYPFVAREFTKVINEINIYGYDLISALRNTAYNTASPKLANLLNGMATTIGSGGNLIEFFEKRAQSLLLEYRLEREKYTRSSETFMDIYISVVIAAPMIFMLLLIILSVSGLGFSMSTSVITILMILGVAVINVIFLMFLHLKQPTG